MLLCLVSELDVVKIYYQWFVVDRKPHNEPDVLSNQKTDLGSRGDVELLVLHLHGISSGLQHSSVIISLSVIIYVPQNASSFARMCHNPKVWNYIYCKTIPSCQNQVTFVHNYSHWKQLSLTTIQPQKSWDDSNLTDKWHHPIATGPGEFLSFRLALARDVQRHSGINKPTC